MCDSTVKFVEMIESYPCLYNNTLQEYSRKDVAEKTWTKISQQMQLPVSECKEKWRNIRNNFVRSLKSSKAKKKYYLHDRFQFVKEYIKPVKRSAANGGNIKLDDGDHLREGVEVAVHTEENSHDSVGETQKVKKRKRGATEDGDITKETVVQLVKSRENRIALDEGRRMLLLSLLSDVERLSYENYTQFRINTLVSLQKFMTEQVKSANQKFHSEESQMMMHIPSCSVSRVSSPAISSNDA